MVVIPAVVEERLRRVAAFIGDTSNDWCRIKQQITLSLPKEYRRFMSHDHYNTHKQVVSENDRAVMALWESVTGVTPYLAPEKIHDPAWVGGYASHRERLRKIHEARRAAKRSREEAAAKATLSDHP